MKMFKQRLEIERLDREYKRSLFKMEAKWRKIIGNLDVKRCTSDGARDNAVDQRGTDLQEKRVMITHHQLLIIERNRCMKQIKMRQQRYE